MDKKNWVWMGHAGHFILGDRCRFHLSTYVGKYVVSTVGELWNDQTVRRIHASIHDSKWLIKNQSRKGDEFDAEYMKRFGFEELSYERKYETMVFKARKSKHKCCPYEIIVSQEMDMQGYNSADGAYKGHLELCNKWSNK